MVETLLLVFVPGCFILAAWLVWVLVKLIKEQQRHHKRPTRRDHALKPANSELQRRLIRLLGGDRTTADRLVKLTRTKYPGQTEGWYWEKTIEDLERDRR